MKKPLKFSEECRKLIESKICQADCCTVAIHTASFLSSHTDKSQAIPDKIERHSDNLVTFIKDKKCIFLNRETLKCEVYADRERKCRDYGESKRKELQCPYLSRAGNRRSEASKKQILRMIKKFQDNLMRKGENNAMSKM